YESAAALVPRHAEIHFRLGQCQLALSNRVAAQAQFSQARDDDALPFRADSRLNAIIEQVGRAHTNHGVHLFDAIAAIAAHSAVGIPGDESFYEHVHFKFDGNYRLGRALAWTITGQLPAHITQRATSSPRGIADGETVLRVGGVIPRGEWATQERCENDLGLTDWNRRDVFDNVMRRLTQSPFAEQPDNSVRVSRWRGRVNEVGKQLTATNAAAARAIYLEALQHRPADFRLHWNFAEFLEAIRDLPRATEEWRQVQSLIPHHHVGHYQVGRLLAAQGRREEARQWLNQSVVLRPDLAAGWLELGTLSLAEGKGEEALRHFALARQLVPQNPQIPFQTAKALSKLKRSDEAIRQVREALQLDPNFWEARSFLGEELAFAGRVSEAQQEFEAVLRVKPDHPWAHLNLGVALFKQGRREEAVRQFEEALRLDPQLLPAKQYLEQLKSRPPAEP
ncbi:MAG TPA: tetratricopeptide repeat protein, partial [Verrucomicrobiae bacterium]|nr:tetratricopeptide repeat protein [Verrucomicrobiae bacterium]